VAADVGLREVADVGARECDPPPLGVHEAQQEVHDRRLAGARRAAQRDVPAGGEPEVDAVEDGGLVGGVARADALERQLRGARRRGQGDIGIADRGLAIGQVEDPAPGGQDAVPQRREVRAAPGPGDDARQQRRLRQHEHGAQHAQHGVGHERRADRTGTLQEPTVETSHSRVDTMTFGYSCANRLPMRNAIVRASTTKVHSRPGGPCTPSRSSAGRR
jgi:hypothetical protein